MTDYRALVCITTCQRAAYLRRYVPHFARFFAQDSRFSFLISLDGADADTVRFCEEWQVPLLHSAEREGVGISKNRVLEAFPDFDYYFFLEDDVELIDGAVFPAHVELSQASGIHHFSLFSRGALRKRTGESVVSGRRVVHCLFGSASFNFFTGTGLRQVGGWHPMFAQYRRFGHTEHSYRLFRSGLAPAPFNVAEDLEEACIFHIPPSVTKQGLLPTDEDHLAVPERELIDRELRYVPLETLSPYRFNGAAFGRLERLAATLDGGRRYPLVTAAERRQCRSDYQLWRFRRASTTAPRRAVALLAAAWEWPANPMLRRTVRKALQR
ncbi:MAG: glycosyltransferase family 2 protein [Mycobacteriales bacterium]